MAKKFIFFKRQISRIEDIGETVKALEKISAANVHNLKITSERMRNYEEAIKEIFCHLSEKDISHPLFRRFTPHRNTISAAGHQLFKRLKVILTTEKGLCGALLNRLLDFVQTGLKENDKILVIGERGRKLCQERKIKIDYFFQGTEEIPKEEDIRGIKDFIISQFLTKKFSQVFIFYPHFKTLVTQEPALFNFLPFDKEKFKQNLGKELEEVQGFPIYEPSQKEIRDYLIREYLGLVFYQKVLETKLSELSARTMAMEEAGEKVKKLVEQLSYQYFRQKREIITKEINDLYAHRGQTAKTFLG